MQIGVLSVGIDTPPSSSSLQEGGFPLGREGKEEGSQKRRLLFWKEKNTEGGEKHKRFFFFSAEKSRD